MSAMPPKQPDLTQQGSALNIPGTRVRVLTRHSQLLSGLTETTRASV